MKRFEALRFGKKIVFDRHISSKELFEQHLQLIRARSLEQSQLKQECKLRERLQADQIKTEDEERQI